MASEDFVQNITQNGFDHYDYLYDYNVNDSFDEEVDEDSAGFMSISYQIGHLLTYYYIPAFVMLGSIGNVLSIIVFLKTKLRFQYASVFLAALAISDSMFLLSAFISWLNYFNVNIYDREYFCQFFTFVSGTSNLLSYWFMVPFSIESLIAIKCPLRRLKLFDKELSHSIIIGLIALGALFSSPYLFYTAPQHSEHLNENICDVREEFKVLNIVYLFVIIQLCFISFHRVTCSFTTTLTLS